MRPELKDRFKRQLDSVLDYQKSMRELGKKYEDLSGLPSWEYQRAVTMAIAAIERVAPASAYARSAHDAAAVDKQVPRPDYYRAFKTVMAVLESLRDAVENDFLDTSEQLVHASVFSDFLEMSQHLLDEGYKDAAAVLAGSSLEAHLRNLCVKNGVPTTVPSGSVTKPKKADLMNADLTKAMAYTVLDQKNVTAWLDLRNWAAHGHYDKYNAEQVALLISGVGEFMARIPA
jgi:hypothetical protein